MDITLRRIKDLVAILEQHYDNGGKPDAGCSQINLMAAAKQLEQARDDAAIALLRNGETVGTVVTALAMSPGKVRYLAESL
ncbi:hypothetical protein D3C85_15390 [compost metagenome]